MSFLDETSESNFLVRNRIEPAKWAAADIAWPALQEIGRLYAARVPELEIAASSFASILQRGPSVHSVRWRVKDPEHLLEKIVRKRGQKSEKYLEISTDNYLSIVTDLIGLRALHLFKSNWVEIHRHLTDSWQFFERAKAYIRAGDETDELRAMYSAADCDVEVHEAAYRSVHYVLKSRPQKQEILAEVQVRTIFEEGWSEIDHHVRYPNFSDNQLLGRFLSLFNRIAGTADEMGNFVQALSAAIEDYGEVVASVNKAQDAHLARIEALVRELQDEKQKSNEMTASLSKLQGEIASLRKQAVVQKPQAAAQASSGPGLAAMLAAFNSWAPPPAAGAVGLNVANPPQLKNLTGQPANTARLVGMMAAPSAAQKPPAPPVALSKKPR